MPSNFFPSSLYQKQITCGDAAKPCSNTDVPFYEMDFQCSVHSVYVGFGGSFNFLLAPGDVYTMKRANLRDIMIINATAGNNGVITMNGSVPNAFVNQELQP